MKTRTVLLTAIALLPCFGIATLVSAPARAENGGQNKTETRMQITLKGAAIKGITPSGHAEFRSSGTQRQLNVEVEKVNLADGSVLTVKVKDTTVGKITLQLGHGKVELNTKDGAVVPAVQKGNVVTVTAADGATVVSGTF